MDFLANTTGTLNSLATTAAMPMPLASMVSNLVDGLACKQALPLLCHLPEQRNVHLVVDKAIHLEHIALAYDTIFANTIFQHLHSAAIPPT